MDPDLWVRAPGPVGGLGHDTLQGMLPVAGILAIAAMVPQEIEIARTMVQVDPTDVRRQVEGSAASVRGWADEHGGILAQPRIELGF